MNPTADPVAPAPASPAGAVGPHTPPPTPPGSQPPGPPPTPPGSLPPGPVQPSQPPPARPPRPAAPAAAVRASLIVGAACALLLPGGPPGIGWPLLGLVAVTALWPLAAAQPYDGAPRLSDKEGHPAYDGRVSGEKVWRGGCLVMVIVLLGAAALRDAAWVVGLNVLAATGLGSLALVRWRSWPGVVVGTLAAGLAALTVSGWLVRGLRATGAGMTVRSAGPVLRGVGLTALVLLVFGPLLASADATFADLLDRLLPALPGEVGGRATTFVLGGLVAAGSARVLLQQRSEPRTPLPRRVLTRTSEWLPPLGALAVLLTAFVLLQAQVLFGGRELVLSRAGLTYAEYARSGFWQLLAVTALVLAVVGAAARWTAMGRGVRALSGALCVLALVIDGSSLWRLTLYIEEYGLSRLRVLVAVACLWLALVLIAVVVAGATRRGGWLPRTVVLSAAAALVGLTLYNPDVRIAESALARGGDADLRYLSTLSTDAVPALDRLPPADRACVLAPIADRLAADTWSSTNVSRSRARELFTDRSRLTGCTTPLGRY